MGIAMPKRREMSEIHITHASALWYLYETLPELSWTTTVIVTVSCQFLVQSFFGGCCFNLLYNISGGVRKCYIYIGWVGGPKTQFLRYVNGPKF